MKKLRKLALALVMGAVILSGGKAHATVVDTAGQQTTEEKNNEPQAADIIAKTNAAMNNVKAISMNMVMMGQSIMEISTDMNTNISMWSISDGTSKMIVWMDQNAGIMYSYDGSTGKYYFQPYDVKDATLTRNTTDTTIDVNTDYMYQGKTTYAGVECYKLSGAVTSNGISIEYTYYIDVATYRIMGMTTQDGIGYVFGYPDAVTVPEEAKNADIAPETAVESGNLSYQTKYKKGEPVLYVKGFKTKKGSVKIPDTVNVYGREYKVYGVNEKAFSGCNITSVSMGKNIQVIEKQAFYQCRKLKSVKISSSTLKKVGSKAFNGNAATLRFKVPKKKVSKYKKMLQKSNISSKLVVSK